MHSFLMLASSSNALLDTGLAWALPVVQIALGVMTLLLWHSTRKNINNFTPSAFRPTYTPCRLVRILVRCGGVHPTDLAPLGAGAHWRHAIAGAMLFIPAGMAWVGMNMWLTQFASDAPVTRGLWSFAAATLVFVVDLGAVSALNGLKGKNIVLGVLPRVAFALTLGYVIAQPFMIIIFKDEIARMQRDKKETEVLDLADRAHEQRERFATQNRPVLEHFKTVKEDLQRRMEALTPRRAQIQARHDELHSQYLQEVSVGQNGRPDGEGKYARFFQAELEKVRGELDGMNRQETALKAEQERLAKDEEEAVARVINDPKFAENAAAMDTLIREAGTSEASSIERQLDLVREYVDEGGSSRWWRYVLWHLLFIFADTIPILTKLLMPKRDYQLLMDMNEKRVEAKVEADRKYAPEFAEEQARTSHESEMRRMKLRFLICDIDLMYQGAAHTVLRGLQIQMETRTAYKELMGRSPRVDEPAGTDWNEAMAPLRRVQESVLETFAKIICDYGNKNNSGKQDDGPPGGGLN